MKRKKLYIICIALMALVMSTTTASAEVTGDQGITELEWALEGSPSTGLTVYVWWRTNEYAKQQADLEAAIYVDENILAENLTANNYNTLGSAWHQSNVDVYFTGGTHTIKVVLTNCDEPEGSNAYNNEIERTKSVGEGFLDTIVNGYAFLDYTVDNAVDDIGVAFLSDLPIMPIIIVLIIVGIILLWYYKKKKKAKMIGRSRGYGAVSSGYNARVRAPVQRRYPPYY